MAEIDGYLGAKTDPTANSAYTLAGVGAGAATPETDEAAGLAALQALGYTTHITDGLGGPSPALRPSHRRPVGYWRMR